MHFIGPEHNETLVDARSRNVRDALAEDIGRGDWTGLLLPSSHIVSAQVVVREEAILCGRDWFEACMFSLDPAAQIKWSYAEGAMMSQESIVVNLRADARALLAAERPALNFLQLLSATATRSHTLVRQVRSVLRPGQQCLVLDTRKTLPGLRQAQKYAVRVGGGANQRMALWDGILIKENHIAAAGGIAQALHSARNLNAGVSIQIEVETLQELEQALNAGAESILLDNFNLDQMREAVQANADRATLEVSGGVNDDTIADIAKTGVHRISVGSLTKDIKAVDYSLRVV
jgi:nicotinate-nucleotide pyrophosphorylase (carboxylating)